MLNYKMHEINQEAKLGIYFHLPFCLSICPYCDFVKTSEWNMPNVTKYFAYLLRQLQFFLPLVTHSSKHCTVYFGGGTPGLFKAHFFQPLMEEIQKYFIIEEATIELNPRLNLSPLLLEYKSLGINRITLGAQSLCNNTLKKLGRTHTNKDIITAIQAARKAGFSQVQVDLIYGIKPNIRTTNVEDEILSLVQYGATGISTYPLSIENRTVFAGSDYANEDTAVDEYLRIIESCTKLDMQQIETSNFSFFEAKHNNIYWYGYPYLGIGIGAHGLLPPSSQILYGIRYAVGSLTKEITPGNDLLDFSLPENKLMEIKYEECRTKQQYIDELIFTLLRTPKGIPLPWLEKETQKVAKIMKDARIQRALAECKIIEHNDSIYLAPSEKMLGDYWAAHIAGLIGEENAK